MPLTRENSGIRVTTNCGTRRSPGSVNTRERDITQENPTEGHS